MQMNAVSAEPVLDSVRGRAVGPVAWTLAWSFAPVRGRQAWAAIAWPGWVALVALGGFVHRDATVVARVRSRRSGPSLRHLGIVLASAVTAGAVLGVASGVAAGADPAAGVLVAVVVLAWPAAAVLVLVVVAFRAWLAISRTQRPARRAASREQRRADAAAIRAADWTVDSVASREPGGALALVARHVGQVVPPGESVRTLAATARHAAVYRRYGLEPLPSRPLVLVGTAPSAR
ncbi:MULTISPECIES: hypothetical protein [unclassified Isoptericola]|uniref:hypothetical protein n=1 Tax=unclassified Isoptericola TaxID=2623355 RepID=UPI0036584809